MEEIKLQILKGRKKLKKYKNLLDNTLEEYKEHLAKFKDDSTSSEEKALLKKDLEYTEKVIEALKVTAIPAHEDYILSELAVFVAKIKQEASLENCRFVLEILKNEEFSSLMRFEELKKALSFAATYILQTVLPLYEGFEDLKDEIATLAFISGLYYPNLFLPASENVKQDLPIEPIESVKQILDFLHNLN